MADRFKRTKSSSPGISKRSGKYEASVNVGGRTHSAGTHPTINLAKEAQAKKKAGLLAQAKATARSVMTDKHTFQEYAEHWLKTRMAGNRPFKPSMERTVRSHLKTLAPVVGKIRLREFSPDTLRTIEPTIATNRSPKYRKNVLQTLVAVLDDAFTFGTLKREVTQHFDYPKIPKYQIEATPLADALKIVAAMRYPMNIAASIAALTGMRQGEVLSLSWADILWEDHAIRVNKSRDQATGQQITPKTDAGTRTVAMLPFLESLLRAYRDRCASERAARAERATTLVVKYGAHLDDHPKFHREYARLCMAQQNTYLFPARTQAVPTNADAVTKARRAARMPVLEARNLHREFVRAREAQGISMRWHDLRHTFASYVLATGGTAALHTLAQHLGHSNVAFTMARYTHMIRGAAPTFLDPMQAALSTGLEGFDLARNLARLRPLTVIVNGSAVLSVAIGREVVADHARPVRHLARHHDINRLDRVVIGHALDLHGWAVLHFHVDRHALFAHDPHDRPAVFLPVVRRDDDGSVLCWPARSSRTTSVVSGQMFSRLEHEFVVPWNELIHGGMGGEMTT